jgi:hypothetical protein
MIVTRIQLYCDGEHGIEIHFPEDAPMDGAILTASELRKEAKKEGWARIEGRDLCDECNAKITRMSQLLIKKYKAQQKAGHL